MPSPGPAICLLACVVLAVLLACSAGVAVVQQRRLRAAHAMLAQQAASLADRQERPNIFGHEVRTPLALISGAAELLAEQSPGPLNERQLEFVRTIATNSRQVISLAEDLLVEARIDNDICELRAEHLDLRELVRQTVREVRRINATVLVLVDHGPPLYVEADPALLRQALWNLVNNAVRHSGQLEPVVVEVHASPTEAVVQVSDDGEGMGELDREALFRPYAVGSSSHPGTGLGMAITQQIVQRHGGRILVETRPGAGTSIVLALPRADGGGR